MKYFMLENVTVQGDVFLERYASVSVGGIFSYFGLILPEMDAISSILIPSRIPLLDGPGLMLNLHDSDKVI